MNGGTVGWCAGWRGRGRGAGVGRFGAKNWLPCQGERARGAAPRAGREVTALGGGATTTVAGCGGRFAAQAAVTISGASIRTTRTRHIATIVTSAGDRGPIRPARRVFFQC
jgi:hypothetical protein